MSVDELGNKVKKTKPTDLSDNQPDDTGTNEKNDINAEDPAQPEALNAPITSLPPTSAAADAEAVAGYTIGSTYGDEGQIKATEKDNSTDSKE